MEVFVYSVVIVLIVVRKFIGNSMTLYMEITQDKYQLPLIVADTPKELARLCGVNTQYIWTYLNHVKNGRIKKPKFIKVEVE